MTAAADYLKEKLGALSPRYGIVLGSGLGALVEAAAEALRIPYADIPDFPVSSVSGHAGELVVGKLGDVPVAMLSGRVHYYERGDAGAMRLPIETLKRIGVENLILTNSAGSLREDMPPGSVMRIADHIAFSGSNPLIGVESDSRFVGMTNAYDAALSERMEEAADRLSIPLWRGVYMWFSGPSFETPAEIRMARIMGADAVGMSTVPEVILARFFGLRVAAASVITNFGAGMTGTELSHEETKEMAPLGGERLSALLGEMIASEG
ncbi:purine-nucleoside phosphorylase [Sinorhizobium alkalisoli]|uniref:Purine nucleoside phosphorylase n=1 Tax=Sinorhizobium alkalisoli TaxID=1752398 RepID=A0A1E3V9F0_9HYPH|nr:purine-nucleoside phosphorylase [Sinorhizobium alkalisoli]ODR90264.1 purine-nucleoside phosphorylase [Sinorhizobium alkalisoli]